VAENFVTFLSSPNELVDKTVSGGESHKQRKTLQMFEADGADEVRNP
jgi:hypothetical protein